MACCGEEGVGYEYRSKVVAVVVVAVVVVVVGGVVSGIIVITSEALRYRFRFLSHKSTRATCMQIISI